MARAVRNEHRPRGLAPSISNDPRAALVVPSTILSREESLGTMGFAGATTAAVTGSMRNESPHWRQSSTPSSIPLLSPSELAGVSSSTEAQGQSFLAHMRQRIEAEERLAHLSKKRPRIEQVLGETNKELLAMSNHPMMSHPSHPGIGNSLLGPSLLRRSSSGFSTLFSSESGASLGTIGEPTSSARIELLLREQQLQDLHQRTQLAEMQQRISESSARENALLQLLLQKKKEEQEQQLQQPFGGSATAAALSFPSRKRPSVEESAVAAFMMKNANKEGGGRITLPGIERMPSAQIQQMARSQHLEFLRKQQRETGGMPPPPPMVSAVSSLDSVSLMQMLLKQPPGPSMNLANDMIIGGKTTPSPSLLGTNNPSLLSRHLPHSSVAAAVSLRDPAAGLLPPALAIPRNPAGKAMYDQNRIAAALEVANAVRDSSIGKPKDAFHDRHPDGRAKELPTLLVVPTDHMQLSSHQTLLRYQIEVFRAGEEDTSTHTRGRNKPVKLGQIGIRCRHCKVLPVSRRKRGSVYFPRAVEGFYQAAQNMNSTHLQTGECPLMGDALRREFANLIATRGVSTGAGRAYWAKQARKLGLRNTDDGIVFDKEGTFIEDVKKEKTKKNATTTTSEVTLEIIKDEDDEDDEATVEEPEDTKSSSSVS